MTTTDRDKQIMQGPPTLQNEIDQLKNFANHLVKKIQKKDKRIAALQEENHKLLLAANPDCAHHRNVVIDDLKETVVRQDKQINALQARIKELEDNLNCKPQKEGV
jgi:prefoldin subunit 5